MKKKTMKQKNPDPNPNPFRSMEKSPLITSILFLSPVSGDEGHQRGLPSTGAHGLSLHRLPADAAVLAA